MVSKLNTPETFYSYYNLAHNQELKVGPYPDLDFKINKINLEIAIDEEVDIIDVQFTSLKTILTDMGGYYSALFHLSLAIATPFLYWHFNSSIVRTIGKTDETQTDEDVLEKCKDRVTFGSLYYL